MRLRSSLGPVSITVRADLRRSRKGFQAAKPLDQMPAEPLARSAVHDGSADIAPPGCFVLA
jgi:hypothetical protein